MSEVGYLVLGGVTGRIGRALTVMLARGGATVAAGVRLHHLHNFLATEHIDLEWPTPTGTKIWPVEGIPVVTDLHQLDQTRRWVVVLAVKSYQVAKAILPILSCCRERIHGFVVPTNGLGSEERVRATFPDLPVVSLTLTYPCEIPGNLKRRIRIMNAAGGIGVGATAAGAQFLTQAVAAVLKKNPELSVEISPHWRAMKWTKCLINSIGNVLPAILQMNLPAVYANRLACRLELELIGEILNLMELQGIRLADLPGYPIKKLRPLLVLGAATYLQPCLGNITAWAYQRYIAPKILVSRGGKGPSLLTEIRQGKRECENLLADIVQAIGPQRLEAPLTGCLADILARRFAGDSQADRLIGSPKELWEACHLRLVKIAGLTV